jgi:hypothetical protein
LFRKRLAVRVELFDEGKMMAVKTVSLMSVLVAFAITLSGQTPPKDVSGWDKIKWGIDAGGSPVRL